MVVFIFSANRYDGATEIIGDQNMNDGDFLNDRSNENNKKDQNMNDGDYLKDRSNENKTKDQNMNDGDVLKDRSN